MAYRFMAWEVGLMARPLQTRTARCRVAVLSPAVKIDSLLTGSITEAGRTAAELETAGYSGAWTVEGPHDPFLPLAVAAASTRRIELGTAIAVAFARNPMLLANIGWDLQTLSRGRFVLYLLLHPGARRLRSLAGGHGRHQGDLGGTSLMAGRDTLPDAPPDNSKQPAPATR